MYNSNVSLVYSLNPVHVGAFVSTHGGSIDEVDRSILEAKKALQEVTHDLTERTQRWRQVQR